jgi:hypothetical protein
MARAAAPVGFDRAMQRRARLVVEGSPPPHRVVWSSVSAVVGLLLILNLLPLVVMTVGRPVVRPRKTRFRLVVSLCRTGSVARSGPS